MRQRYRILVISICALALASVAFAATEAFVLDRVHSSMGFRIRHIVTKVDGLFREYDGGIWIDRENPAASRVEVTIQAASIDTREERRDNHLRSAEFFDVQKYPTITFKSRKVEPQGGDLFNVTGDLTIHGVTKTIRVPVWHRGFAKMGRFEKTGFETSFMINRKDFGITWNRSLDEGGLMLGDEVEISFQVEANKEMPAPEPTKAPTP